MLQLHCPPHLCPRNSRYTNGQQKKKKQRARSCKTELVGNFPGHNPEAESCISNGKSLFSLAARWGYVLAACLHHNGPGITGKHAMAKAMETPTPETLVTLRARLADFAARRDWDQFHSPKNLAMALIAETAELVEHFQWLTTEQSQQLPSVKLAEVRLELADILIYLIRIADKLDVDLASAVLEKIAINEQRYPIDRVRGDARRAEEYPPDE